MTVNASEMPRWRSLYLNASRSVLAAFVLLGIMQCFVMPPFQTPDEPAHWSTAVSRAKRFMDRSNGSVCSLEMSLPLFFEFYTVNFQKSSRVPRNKYASLRDLAPTCEQTSVSYGSALTYPAVMVSELALPDRSAEPRQALMMFYLSRLLAGAIVALAFARLICLFRKAADRQRTGLLSALGLALSPLFVQQSFSVTADTLIFVFTVSLVSLLLFWGRLTWLDFIIYASCGWVVSSTKPVLLPAIAGAAVYGVLMQSGSFHPKAVWRCVPRLRTPEGLALLLLPVFVALGVYTTFFAMRESMPIEGRFVSPAAQIRNIAEHPLGAVRAVAGGFHAFSTPHYLSQPLGWMDTDLFPGTFGIWLLFLLLLIGADTAASASLLVRRLQRSAPTVACAVPKIAAALAAAASIYCVGLLSSLSMYLAFTTVGNPWVQGLQGRYFFPAAFLGLVFLQDVLSLRGIETADGDRAGLGFNRGQALRTAAAVIAALIFGWYLCSIFVDLAARYY